jgi:hypothetical protein
MSGIDHAPRFWTVQYHAEQELKELDCICWDVLYLSADEAKEAIEEERGQMAERYQEDFANLEWRGPIEDDRDWAYDPILGDDQGGQAVVWTLVPAKIREGSPSQWHRKLDTHPTPT